jgi:hypothetical protein
MKFTKYNRNRLLKTFEHWRVPREFAEPMYNYLVHGYSPGSCFTSVLANDFAGAIHRSHPGNTVEAFKALTSWIQDNVPYCARGSYDSVDAWCYTKSEYRRKILEDLGMIYSEEEEVLLVLRNQYSEEPILY